MLKGSLKYFWITIVIYLIVTLPFLISNMLSVSWFGFAPGKEDSWIGFWGSYLGAIVGMIAIFITTQITLKKSEDSLNKQLLLQREEAAFWRLIDILENRQIENDDSISKKIQIYEDELTQKKMEYFYDNYSEMKDLILKLEEHQCEIITEISDYMRSANLVRNDMPINIFEESTIIQHDTPFRDEYRKLVDRGSFPSSIDPQELNAQETYEFALLKNYQELDFIKERLKSLDRNKDYQVYMNKCEKNAKDELMNNKSVEQRVELIKIIKEHQNEIKSKLAHSYYNQLKSKETLDLEKIFKMAE